MFAMFPSIRKKMIAFLVGFNALCIANLILNPGSWILTVVLLLVGNPALYFMEYLNVAKAHDQLISVLYKRLDARGFLKQYEPFLKLNIKKESLRIMTHLHASNAYIALGRFDDAEKLLLSTEPRQKKEEENLTSQFALVSNLCFCACQEGNLEKAEKYQKQSQEIQRRLEKIQESKPVKKRMVYNTVLQDQCVAYLQTGHLDSELLRNQVQAHNEQPLHRITTGLWIAKGDLAENRRKIADEAFAQIVKLAPDLYPGKEAARLMKISDESHPQQTESVK